jgi:hypothetical protein
LLSTCQEVQCKVPCAFCCNAYHKCVVVMMCSVCCMSV